MRHWTWTHTIVVIIELAVVAMLFFCLFGCSSSKRLTTTDTSAHQAHVSQVDSGSTVATRDTSGIHVSNTHTETDTETSNTERIVEKDSTVIREHADGTRDTERHHTRTRTLETGKRTMQNRTEDTRDTTAVTASNQERRGSVHQADTTSSDTHTEARKEKKSSWTGVWISGASFVAALVFCIFLPYLLTRKR